MNLALAQSARLHALSRTVSRRACKRFLRECAGRRVSSGELDAALAETETRFGRAAIDAYITEHFCSVWTWKEKRPDGSIAAVVGHFSVGEDAPYRSAKQIEAVFPVEALTRLGDSIVEEAGGKIRVARPSREDFAAAEAVAGIADETAAEATVLWEPPESDHASWLAAGCGELQREEYMRRLDAVEIELWRGGKHVVRCRATTAEVLAELSRLGLPNDGPSRAAAVSILWMNS